MDLDEPTIEAGHHVVQFYERDESLALAVSSFLGAGLVSGEAAVVVATAPHRASFEAVLAAAGVNVALAARSGQYVAVDAAELMAGFMAGGHPDPGLFSSCIGGVVAAAGGGERPVRIYGEMVALLWDAGHVTAAMEVEALWNGLADHHDFSLFCAYPMASIAGSPTDHDAICEHHSRVVPELAAPQPTTDRAVRRFEPTVFAPQAVRRFVGDLLDTWGLEAAKPDAVLVASELAANAAIHVARRFAVEVTRRSQTLRVAVVDRSAASPLPSLDQSTEATSGRGMYLVDAIARRWGTDVGADGKSVWAEIAL